MKFKKNLKEENKQLRIENKKILLELNKRKEILFNLFERQEEDVKKEWLEEFDIDDFIDKEKFNDFLNYCKEEEKVIKDKYDINELVDEIEEVKQEEELQR